MKHGKKFGFRESKQFDISKYTEESISEYREGHALVQEQHRKISKEAAKHYEQLIKDLDKGREDAISKLYLGLVEKE